MTATQSHTHSLHFSCRVILVLWIYFHDNAMTKEIVTFFDLSVKVLSLSSSHKQQSTNLPIYTIYPFPVKNSTFYQEFHQPERMALDQNVSLTEN
jgi:hypothetical protein